MHSKIVCFFVAILMGLAFPVFCYSERADNRTDEKTKKQVLSLPFPFYNENFGAAAGYVYGLVGYPQKQSSLIATAMGGSKGSGMGFLMATDLRLPWSDRLFLDPVISTGYFTDADAFVDGNPSFSGLRAGSNDSDKDNFVTGDGWDIFFRMKFKYLLPIGNGKDEIITNYVLEKGLLKSGATGGTSLNPFKSGRTFLEFRPFYRSQQIEGDDFDNEIRTNGIDLAVFWDNRDFNLNPSHGNSIRIKVSRDFGAMDSSNSWTCMDGDLDTYVSLGETDIFKKRVLAFDVWTSYSPTWENGPNNTVSGRPPAYIGATLGGLWRMKGYPSQRFSDKSAIYYSAEYRLTPKWNPFDKWHWLQKRVGVQWIQFVPFVEIGRVAPSWNFRDLHSDMKWSSGLGLRAMAKGLVVRIDTAASDESANIQMMINQPFQF